jgi:hypothetical protein
MDMPESSRIWTETLFNIAYLIVVWWVVIVMINRRELVEKKDQRVAGLIMWAFFLLGLGDIGHVGFRVVAFAMGGLEAAVALFGREIKLAPMGALATAITFTFFYVILIMVWRERFDKKYGVLGYLLFVLAAVRLIIMAFPANNWNSIQPPQQWAIARNVPLMLMQLVSAYLLMRDGLREGDKTFVWMAVMVIVSFVCYAPVIFLQQRVPLIGMLMIPKTIAYLVIAFLGFFRYYRIRPVREAAGSIA